MEIESQINENTRNIATLTATVTELSTIMKYETDRAKEDRGSVKDMVNELKSLNEKITGIAGVQKEQAQAAKDITELRTRVDNLKEWKDRFDLSNMLTRITALEIVNTKEDGIKQAVSTGAEWFWRIFGPALTALAVAGCAWYFSHRDGGTYRHTEDTYTGSKVHGTITGE